MKIIFYSYFILFTLGVCAQTISTDPPQLTRPEPSTSGLMTFVEVPVDTYTGIPNINIPFFSLPTRSSAISVSCGLSYHPAGVSLLEKSSDVGTGWSLMAAGAISRTIVNVPDEYFETNYTETNKDYDIYTYNFLGINGRFKIVKDGTSNNYIVQKLDNSTSKIEFIKNPTTTVIESFTVFDDKGFKYVFTEKNFTANKFYLKRALPTQANYGARSYIDTYYISKVYDPNNNLLLDYTYQSFSRTFNSQNNNYTVFSKKISSLLSTGFGKIEFSFVDTGMDLSSNLDPIKLTEVVLKDTKNTIISKVKLNQSLTAFNENDRRYLDSVDYYGNSTTPNYSYNLVYKFNINDPYSCNDQTKYGMDMYGYPNMQPLHPVIQENTSSATCIDPIDLTYPNLCNYGILEKMITPTKGVIEYSFESNTIKASREASFYNLYPIHLAQELNSENFSLNTIHQYNNTITSSTTWQFTITNSSPRGYFFKVSSTPYTSPISENPSEPLNPTIVITGNNFYYNFNASDTDLNQYTCIGRQLFLPPGTYTVSFSKLNGTSSNVSVNITEVALNTTLKGWVYQGGLRIKAIRFKENLNDTSYLKETLYDYQDFSDPLSSSGELIDGYFVDDSQSKVYGAQIGYYNVKERQVANGIAKGETRFTYNSLKNDFPSQSINGVGNFTPQFFEVKKGILKKVEVFDSNLNLLNSTENTYSFEENPTYVNMYPSKWSAVFVTKPSFIKQASSKFRKYFGTQYIENEEVKVTNSTNKQLESATTVLNSNDNIIKRYYYHTGNSTYTQNRISEIEEIKEERNSEQISDSKILYSNAFVNNTSYLPVVIQNAKGTNSLESKIRFNRYDSYSNPLEIQQGNGLKICYIWGYNNTQVVAKIENISYDAIPSNLITSIQNATDNQTETDVLNALNALRTNAALINSSVTTITHIPLVGESTITDPKGIRLRFYYDSMNRLLKVIDSEGNIVSENQYNYRP